MIKSLLTLVSTLFIVGCSNNNQIQTPDNKQGTNLTVGVVQKEIKLGMTQDEVASVLGSPNIVSSIEKDKETWIYDKISSSVSYQKSGGYGTILIIGSEEQQGNMSYSQKSLTVIIKFEKGKVDDFKYHTSRY